MPATSAPARPAVPTGKPGGTIKAAWHGGIDFIDPALAYYQESWQIEYATCVKLLNYPDKPAPEGYQLQPEAASAMPTVSSDGLTVTFTVPAGKYKFNTGEPVTAQTFADSLMRDLNPKQVSPFVSFVGSSIEGATGWNGKGTIPGVQVNGDQLILHLTKPNGTIEAEMATPFMCAVPHDLAGQPRRASPRSQVPAPTTSPATSPTSRWWSRRTRTTPVLVRT